MAKFEMGFARRPSYQLHEPSPKEFIKHQPFEDIVYIPILTKEFDLHNRDDDKFHKTVQQLSQKLLASKDPLGPTTQLERHLQKRAYSYRNVMEEVWSKLDSWFELREKNIRNIQITLRRFSSLRLTTASITLVSSTLEFLFCLGTLMNKVFQFNMNPRYSLIVNVAGGLSITCSFAAFMYSNHCIEDIVRDLRNEKYLLREIETAYRMGNWIDKEMQDLFPYGIDLKLVARSTLDAEGNLLDKWEQRVCSAIILCNAKEDKKLLRNRKFLSSVKAFVESTAAQIWIDRLILRSLLDDMTRKVESIPDKRTEKGNAVFLNLAVINLYPFFFSLFWDSKKLRQTKFLWNSLAALSTVVRLSNNRHGFEGMKSTSTELQNYYRHIKKITQNVFTDYD